MLSSSVSTRSSSRSLSWVRSVISSLISGSFTSVLPRNAMP
ncbi:hypothetical protein BMETH_693_1 [methanotrophic bacterial endosymbiont of Bathymodiolus sp.]|nr:hypothetical protein BMETH_693_1 [methanotrophic bacterial endosymbiont of Bathymodiolus sp.]